VASDLSAPGVRGHRLTLSVPYFPFTNKAFFLFFRATLQTPTPWQLPRKENIYRISTGSSRKVFKVQAA
jgi:hypothetical protein